MSAIEHMVPLRSIHNPAMVVEQRKVVKGTHEERSKASDPKVY
jgi:hypothetical protein